jgi:hypothetical protein
MQIEEIWVDIENELTWRTNEIRFFQNQSELISQEDQKDQFRRVLILLLYAHFEGFCKFSFLLYVNAINNENIKCKDANYTIAAATLSNVFRALRNNQSKCDIFRKTLPDDTKLHQLSREIEFVEKTQLINDKLVVIPESIVDTESNLKPIVLRKILYSLGFPHDQFDSLEENIKELLKYRNSIAHGEMKDGINETIYNELKASTLLIMNKIKSDIMSALSNKTYLKT